MKKFSFWLAVAVVCCFGLNHPLYAAPAAPKPALLRLVYVGAISGYLNLCG